MNKFKALIIDDERQARNEMIRLLREFSEIEIVGESDNLSGSINLIHDKKPDIVFLDIQLAGENGFNLLEKVAITFKLVFVTAYDEYAVRAFDVNASDYLLKPVDPERLKTSVQRITKKLPKLNTIEKKFKFSDSVYVKLNNSTAKFIKISAVVTILSVGNYSKLCTTDANSYLVLKTIKKWEEELPSDFFIRINRAAIINIEHVIKIEKFSTFYFKVYLDHHKEPLEVSRSCASKIKEIYHPK